MREKNRDFWKNEGLQLKMDKRVEAEGGRAERFKAGVKASRSQRFPLNLEQTTNSECLLQQAEWLIIMAACFDLVPASLSALLSFKSAVTSELTCGQAYYLQLQFRHLADALIQSASQ